MRRALVVGVIGCVALTVALLTPSRPATAAADRPAPSPLREGVVLGPETAAAARGLLPEEILAHYERGEYRNPIIELGKPGQRPLDSPPEFVAASRANRGRFALTAAGSLVEAATGTQPTFVIGLPFPDIDPDDPQAGSKIVWNHFYTMWYRGDYHFLTEIVLTGRRGVERRIVTDVRQRMYDGTPEARGRPNPSNLLLQTIATVVAPADLAGTVSLTWRYRDPARRDALWTYVPGLRRPRQVSPLNRSDGFLGSDVCMDDGPFFDGKPEDFAYRLLERRDQLALVDPFSVRGEAELVPVTGGGWRTVWKPVPRIGADDPNWRGLPWAPVSAALARRSMWIVEAVPRDPNYLFGRIVLRVDAETFNGAWVSKYDRAGRLMTSYQVSLGSWYSMPDGTWIASGGLPVQTAENVVLRRATSLLFPPRNPDNPADYRITTDPALFTPDVLVRLGK